MMGLILFFCDNYNLKLEKKASNLIKKCFPMNLVFYFL